MAGIVLLCVAALLCFIAGRRSIVAGIVALMTVGYGYGILRANIPTTPMHFLFDAGTVGLYLALVTRGLNREQRQRFNVLLPWLVLLIGWPVLLFFFPVQDPLIQLVGLRGQIFFIPFILIGAMLEEEDWYRLARWVAVLNLAAFGFAIAEYIEGVPKFFPRNEVTQIIYLSNDVMGRTQFRIPATFVNSAAFSGTMVATVLLLLGAWAQRRASKLDYWLLSIAILASGLGVFMGASRTQAATLLLMVGLTFLMGKVSLKIFFRVALVVAIVGYIVATNPRMQRFTSLSDTDFVQQRINNSVNDSLFAIAIDNPMGAGLGAGGTSIPYFLQDRIKRDYMGLENEYSRIILEQGIPGLFIFVGFLGWVMISPQPRRNNPWNLALRLARIYLAIVFATASLGTGVMTSIPGTAFILMLAGWVSTTRSMPAVQKTAEVERIARTRLAGNIL